MVAAAQLGHEALHAEPGQGVQRSKGFVEKQELRLANQGSCQRHALRLPAREGSGPCVGVSLETYFTESGEGSVAGRLRRGGVR